MCCRACVKDWLQHLSVNKRGARSLGQHDHVETVAVNPARAAVIFNTLMHLVIDYICLLHHIKPHNHLRLEEK